NGLEFRPGPGDPGFRKCPEESRYRAERLLDVAIGCLGRDSLRSGRLRHHAKRAEQQSAYQGDGSAFGSHDHFLLVDVTPEIENAPQRKVRSHAHFRVPTVTRYCRGIATPSALENPS